MPKSFKSLLGSLILFAVVSLIGFLALEWVVRQLPAFSQYAAEAPAMYRPHPTRAWVLKPDLDVRWPASRFQNGGIQVVTDAMGNRVVPPSNKSKDLPAYRIMVLGDSFTFGWGVEGEEAFASLLREQLDERFPDRRFVVVNTGVPGYGPDNEMSTLKEQFEAAQPDLVIVGFTENDFENTALGYNYNDVVDGHLVKRRDDAPKPQNQSLAVKAKKFMYRHSAVYRVVYFKMKGGQSSSPRKTLDEKPFQGWGLEILRKQPKPEVAEVFKRTGVILNQMKAYLAERDAQLLVVTLPRSYLVYESEFENRLKATDESPEDFWIGQLTHEIEAVGREFQIPVLSLRQTFIDANQPRESLYIPFDGHWKAEGHRLCSQSLTPVVAEMITSAEAAPTRDED